MTIDALHPIAGNHAIQCVAFVLQWPVPLEKKHLLLARSKAEQLKPWFSAVQEQQSVMIEFGIGPEHQQVRNAPKVDDLEGIQFLQPNAALGPAGTTRTLQVNKDQLAIVVNDYTTWNEAWPNVKTWLNILLPLLLDGRPISAAILQYNDVFEWRANPAEMVLHEIFRTDSKYLSRCAFEARGLWHLHQGYMDDHSEPIDHQLIENVNVNMMESNARRAISIFTSHHGILRAPLWEAGPGLDKLDALMDYFHDRNKAVIRDILTAQVCKKINLI